MVLSLELEHLAKFTWGGNFTFFFYNKESEKEIVRERLQDA